MNSLPHLFLHEQILLLALCDEKGTIDMGVEIQYPLAGAIAAELLLNHKIKVDESGRRKLVNLVDPAPIGDPILDECLGKVRKAKRRASLQTWVQRFSSVKKLKQRLALQLCNRGILKADEATILHIFKRKIYPEINHEPEQKFIEQMREAIFTDRSDIDPKIIVLISLAQSADLLKMAFDKKELKQRKARIKQLINGEITGKATKEAIEAMHTAVVIACFVPIIAATAVTN